MKSWCLYLGAWNVLNLPMSFFTANISTRMLLKGLSILVAHMALISHKHQVLVTALGIYRNVAYDSLDRYLKILMRDLNNSRNFWEIFAYYVARVGQILK